MHNSDYKLKDPYEGINFVTVKSQIKSNRGEIIFNEAVEFPDYFDKNSISIVASKYLCNNAKLKETSLKQLIDRVSFFIADLGKKDGYFKNEEEYYEFLYKLRYYQVRQYFAFNSPVYFNAGISEKFQSSACFILEIKDNMESIFDIAKTESLIFKRGSGSGMNISPLRSCKEKVSGAGYASGPVSFMKAHDTIAGIIKSGGTLRRSAKLVCMNIDHPDIEEFIECKLKEEQKLEKLLDLDIPLEVGEELRDHVFYQNTNLSVRVTDDFMQRVEQDRPFWTKYVLDGRKHKKYKAKELLLKIAEIAWKTGDPGIQFHDNTNKWNTCRASGEINASNPCLPIWALVLTPDGYRRLGDLENKVYIDGEKFDCSDVMLTKESDKVYEVVLQNGMSIYATKNHIVKTNSGDLPIEKLKIGKHKLKLEYCNFISKANDKIDYKNGFLAGLLFSSKGSIYKKNERTTVKVTIKKDIVDEKELNDLLLSMFSGSVELHQHPKKETYISFKIEDEENIEKLKQILKCDEFSRFDLFAHNLSFQRGFISAISLIDGKIRKDEKNPDIYIPKKSIGGYYLLKLIQLSLSTMGVYSSIGVIKERDKVSGKYLSISDIYNFRNIITDSFGANLKLKNEIETLKINQQSLAITKLKKFSTVVAIKERKTEEPVYDISVPDKEYFVTNGVQVHNCGEFVFLDNSSCNLASINLLKFFNRDENGKILFDYDTFEDVVKTVITAQDIVIDNSYYPIDKIRENSINFRPLGLGYTNLGGLLMWIGVPYDSDAGRNIASKITALMTGIAYLRSNELAELKGEFSKFSENKKYMYDVLQEHIHHVHDLLDRNISCPIDLTEHVKKTYDKLRDIISSEKPFRNAQVTLLAPTGCLVKDSLILTSAGFIELEELCPDLDRYKDTLITEEMRWQPLENIKVLQKNNSIADATQFYFNGVRNILRVETENGKIIEGTPNHKLEVLKNGKLIWKRLDELEPGDYLVGILGGHEKLLANQKYYFLDNSKIEKSDDVSLPFFLNEEIAYFIGLLSTLSTITDNNTVTVYFEDKKNVEKERFFEILKDYFSISEDETKKYNYSDFTSYTIKSNKLVSFLQYHNFVEESVPKQILLSKTSVIIAYLRGFFDSNCSVDVSKNQIITAIPISKKKARQIQFILETLDIPSEIREVDYLPNKCAIIIINTGYGICQFRKKISFSDANILKRERMIQSPKDCLKETLFKKFPSLTQDELNLLSESNLFIYPVKRVLSVGQKETYDISVPINNYYLANGFISHNTISYLMGAATTGIEPEFSLIKEKLLYGTDGGSIKIQNPILKESLINLGYTDKEITRVFEFLSENKPIEECPIIKEDHLPIFDTSINPIGKRIISPEGHLLMMAAVQPFISGAISKTVNLPNNCTPEDVLKIYINSWKLGLKGITIYRDGSKRFQPLSSISNEQERKKKTLKRKKLPDERQAKIKKFQISGVSGYLIMGFYEDGSLGELFIQIAKEGSTLSGLLDAWAITLSIARQYGVPLKDLVKKLMFTRFDPAGFTGDPNVPIATSIIDYISRYLGYTYLNKEEQEEIGLYPNKMNLESHDEDEDDTGKVIPLNGYEFSSSAPACRNCGSFMLRKGSCYLCVNCGTNEGSCG